MPYGGYRMVESGIRAYRFEPDRVTEILTMYRHGRPVVTAAFLGPTSGSVDDLVGR
jgi:hypothetical protein